MKAKLFFIVCCAVVACSSLPLSDKAKSEIASHGAILAACQAAGRDAGSLDAYNACKADAGVK